MNASFTVLLGKMLTSVENLENEELRFTTDTGEVYRLYHYQDCCESVTIEDIDGDLQNLVSSPLVQAEVAVSDNQNPEGVPVPEWQDSFTWTFYKLATTKGYVTIRWYGTSNGYYSESVDFEQVDQ